MKRKRTEMVVELDEVFIIRSRPTMAIAWCADCKDQVRMLAPDEAAAISGHSARQIYRWVEAKRIHFYETGERHLLICQSSLLKSNLKGDDFDQ